MALEMMWFRSRVRPDGSSAESSTEGTWGARVTGGDGSQLVSVFHQTKCSSLPRAMIEVAQFVSRMGIGVS